MPTGQVIINNALTRLGILEQGGTPNTSDAVDALANLNDMWNAWGIDEGLIYSVLEDTVGPITASTPFVTFGPTQRPNRVYSAAWVFTINASQGRRNLKVVTAAEFYAHADLNASASVPDEIYPDFNVDSTTGESRIYFWPIPTSPTVNYLRVVFSAPFPDSGWALNTNYFIPDGYQDAITWALAFRLLSTFGAAVAPEVAQNVTAIGSKAEARIREMNAKNRMLSPGAANSPETILQQAAAAPQKV